MVGGVFFYAQSDTKDYYQSIVRVITLYSKGYRHLVGWMCQWGLG